MAAQSSEIHNKAYGLAEGEIECWCCILPYRDGDCREPLVEWFRRVSVLGKKGLDFGTNGMFPVGMNRNVQKYPAS